MSGQYTALRPDNETGVAYMRRASASFEGVWLNCYLKNTATQTITHAPSLWAAGTTVAGATAALYECTFNTGDIQFGESVAGAPSVY